MAKSDAGRGQRGERRRWWREIKISQPEVRYIKKYELSIDNCHEAAPFEEKRFEPERKHLMGVSHKRARMCLSRPLLYLDFSRTSRLR